MRNLNSSEWYKITSDLWILDTVQNGYQIEFEILPKISSVMREINFSTDKAKVVTDEVNKLLAKGAILKVDPVEGQFISNIFLVPKKDGTLRPVINLKNLNTFVKYQHFKQENISFALDLINRNDFLTSIDLTDAYFSLGIHKDFKKYLRFSWNNNLYEFQVLCFGLASAPRVFTKVLKPVYAFFRKLGIRCIYYIDDSLCVDSNFDDCQQKTVFMTNQLDKLGYRVNLKKSVLVPTKRIVFFGLIIDTVVFKVFLTEEKIDKIVSLGKLLLNKERVLIRCLASFIGLVVHAFNAVTVGPLHYRSLERDKISALSSSNGDFDTETNLSEIARKDILWWVSNLKKFNGKLIRPNTVDFWIECDASIEGWGAKFGDKLVGGRWNKEETQNHINFLELMAIFYSLQSFFSKEKSLHIGICSDNTTAVAYINEMGGMASPLLDELSSKIWSWCFDRDIFISAQHIPGSHNFDADHMSRNFTDSTEWKLKPEIFTRICRHFFEPDIDLFASRLNAQLETFVSWSYDPQSSYTDAFSISWSDFNPYIFPPFSLIGKIINKIVHDNVRNAILVVPFWPCQSWYPLLLSVLISLPVRLPRHQDLVTMPHSGQCHPFLKRLNLIVCLVSGQHSLVKDFRKDLLKLSLPPGDRQLIDNMSMLGGNTYFGVIKGMLIPFVQLRRT